MRACHVLGRLPLEVNNRVTQTEGSDRSKQGTEERAHLGQLCLDSEGKLRISTGTLYSLRYIILTEQSGHAEEGRAKWWHSHATSRPLCLTSPSRDLFPSQMNNIEEATRYW